MVQAVGILAEDVLAVLYVGGTGRACGDANALAAVIIVALPVRV